MGKKDTIAIEYFENAERFADLINGYVYEGEKVILPENIKKENRSWTKKTDKELQTVYRDIVREIGTDMHVMLVAIEEQSDIHYAMPLRVMNADCAMYDRQWREIRKEHTEKKDVTGAEYLSGFSKQDRLIPVITIVIYLGNTEWDGPRKLTDILDMNGYSERMKRFVSDYQMQLLDVRRYKALENFQTDLKYVFGFLQKEQDKYALKMYLQENEEEFTRLSEEAYDMISIFSHSKELVNSKKTIETEGGMNVCKAIQDMIADGREEGIKEGRSDMLKLAKQIFQLYRQEKDLKQIAAECNTTLELVQELLIG